ncbi:aromatic ring-hydroxylating oxygenase subunit alpha [Yinghuangia seranimata]|uniref:aromatic ring-hydroxylating oxygenase subunit alpha n=1 Tax=Yinghuangia seranimata TaxID=408067 RepID=UPI00248AFC56|nr:aromatic ring-hydroxylating dioxygenase subunit alpha [Yinghuangia seranimata]MDI2124914.1 aromatic ring-hydroxylating dioxygenase subunit alpha [Yinghuangia seranimata]
MTATQDHPATADARLHTGVDDGTATGPVDPSAGLVRVPAHRYTSAEFAELELRRLWTRTWQLACSVDHVAEPGDFFEYRVGPYAVVVVRDDEGVLRAFQNVCRHRGNSLCSGAGSGLTELKCGYHGWTWDLAGQLRRVPGRKGFGGLKLSEFPLLAARVDTWGPFVFVNLDPQADALDTYLEAVPEDAAWARVEEFRCTATVVGDVAANWKTVVDGFSETYHIQTLHPELMGNIDDVNAPQRLWGHTGKSEQLYGLASPRIKAGLSDQEVWDSFVLTQGQRMGVTEPGPVPPVPEDATLRDVIAERIRAHVAASGTDLSGFDTDRIMRLHQYQLFPNCSVLLTADTLSALVARPGPTPGTAEMGIFAFRRAAGPDAPYRRPTDLRVAFEDLDLGYVLNQDAAVLAGVQRGLNQPGLTELVLSQEEKRVINTHRNLERYLGIGPKD